MVKSGRLMVKRTGKYGIIFQLYQLDRRIKMLKLEQVKQDLPKIEAKLAEAGGSL